MIDELRPSYSIDEKAHDMKGENTKLTYQAGHSPALGFNTWEKTRWGREATGWFSYDMKVDKNKKNYLVVTYWGNEDKDHVFDILINGTKIATETLFDKHPVTFYEATYEVPDNLIKGKDKVTICFQSQSQKTAGTVFALKVTTNPRKFPNYSFYF